jgi:hypothetical protein
VLLVGFISILLIGAFDLSFSLLLVERVMNSGVLVERETVASPGHLADRVTPFESVSSCLGMEIFLTSFTLSPTGF